MFTTTAAHTALALSLATALAGCGGGQGGSESAQPPAATAAATTAVAASGLAAPAASQHAGVLPLFEDDGRPRPTAPQHQPADRAARSRSGLYATQAQYEWQELIAGPYTVLIDIDTLGSVEAAMLQAAQAHELRAMDPSPERQALSYFVRARQPASAAAVADRLTDAGFDAVFMLR